MNKNCIFCDREKIKDDIIYETENFFVKIGLGIVAPGHVMTITKNHYTCFAAISNEILDEHDNLSEHLQSAIRKAFAETFLVEYGCWGQSVDHAHIHFIPLRNQDYNIESIIKEMVIPGKIDFEETNRERLKEIFKTEGRYLTIEEKGKLYVCHIPNKPKDELRPYLVYRIFLNQKGINVPISWKEMSEEDKKEDEEKRKLTRDRLIKFL